MDLIWKFPWNSSNQNYDKRDKVRFVFSIAFQSMIMQNVEIENCELEVYRPLFVFNSS